ncbi:hypothetical protein FRC10_001808, partial [Ceratobasidium sp. 414]
VSLALSSAVLRGLAQARGVTLSLAHAVSRPRRAHFPTQLPTSGHLLTPILGHGPAPALFAGPLMCMRTLNIPQPPSRIPRLVRPCPHSLLAHLATSSPPLTARSFVIRARSVRLPALSRTHALWLARGVALAWHAHTVARLARSPFLTARLPTCPRSPAYWHSPTLGAITLVPAVGGYSDPGQLRRQERGPNSSLHARLECLSPIGWSWLRSQSMSCTRPRPFNVLCTPPVLEYGSSDRAPSPESEVSWSLPAAGATHLASSCWMGMDYEGIKCWAHGLCGFPDDNLSEDLSEGDNSNVFCSAHGVTAVLPTSADVTSCVTLDNP